ncbi:S8 family serine peptidase [Adhaeribacter sp. BT258]|uniref:S8 family serine peptidase n=1 Tax=Adhaeribacter terrigena TaxID=2793070 RepID=A0ABS1C1C7_9BACT|nr:S8 family serine peptidase [Adhaeribacter terrigena]MBK0403133.1 S8 family serine peptidase [Adhaeribacter terrigena]
MKANQFKKAVSYFALASVFTMAGCQKDDVIENDSASNQPNMTAGESGKAIEGQYIVTLKSGETTTESINEMITEEQISAQDVGQKFDGAIKGFTGKLSKDQLEALRQNPNVASIEQDRIISLSDNSTTIAQPSQTIPWGVARVGYGDGTGKTAWVIDSGINPNHPDLNVDQSRSKSFITGITSFVDGYGHGTMVSGIIGAKNNSEGVVGVAANATIVALRVFDDAGRGSVSTAIKAVNHVIANAKAGDVVNMSLGSGVSATLDNAVKSAAAKGILFAIASGNSGIDCSGSSPARADAPGIYTVSSMNNLGQFSGFSNYGASVDFAAPGEGIPTTNKAGGYSSGSGTSYASPHIAGLLLLNGNAIRSRGTVTGDKDSTPDPIASK